MHTPSLTEAVRHELLVRSEVTESTHRFGGIEFKLGRRELGHLHGDEIADLPFPRRVRDALIAAGRATPHHALRDSGWVRRRVRTPEDVEAVVELFRLSYERAVAARSREEVAA
jgi:ribosomal 50S subunit-associated protein YjgA (DUF615 family)